MSDSTTKKSPILAIVLTILGIVGLLTAIYFLLIKKPSQTQIKALNQKAIDDAKAAAAVKAQVKTATKANPTDPAIAALQAQLATLLKQASDSKAAAQKAGGGGPSGGGGAGSGGSKANADGSKPTAKTDEFGNEIGTTVDKDGNYIEKGDPTTLYNSSGQAIGDLNPQTGMFEDKDGKVIASSDGTPVAATDAYGNYQDPSGSWYSEQGIEIQKNADGSYYEKDDPSTLYSSSGDPIGDINSTDGSVYDAAGNYTGYVDDNGVFQANTASDYNDPNYDPNLDPNSATYIGDEAAGQGAYDTTGTNDNSGEDTQNPYSYATGGKVVNLSLNRLFKVR